MVQQYKSSNQAKTQPSAGYARGLPKGAPPVPAFLPAKAAPAATAVAPTSLPPRAGGELTRRVADQPDYSRAYAQARAQQAGPPAQRPGAAPPAGAATRPPAGVPSAVLGPLGRMGAPPAGLPAPGGDDVLRELALARMGGPTYEQLPALPGSEYAPLYSETPSPPEDEPPAEGEEPTGEEGEEPTDEEGEEPTDEEGGTVWDEAKESLKTLIEEKGGPLAAAAYAAAMQALLDMEQGKDLSKDQLAVLKKLEEMGWEAPEGLHQAWYEKRHPFLLASAKDKLSKGHTHLTQDEYGALHREGELPTKPGWKWAQGEGGGWQQVEMTEDELLDQELDAMTAEIADDTSFYKSIDAYVNHMRRKLAEQQYLAGGQMSGTGLWQTGMGARRLMQLETAHMSEMSAAISDMIVKNKQTKWQAQLQILSQKTGLWAQRKQLEIQATTAAFNAAMQGLDVMMEYMDAEGLGDYADEYFAAVQACQEFTDAESLRCVMGIFEGFRIDHEGGLAWGIPTKAEIYDKHKHSEAKATKMCGSCWNPFNAFCCIEHGSDDDKQKYQAPNPYTGKQYEAGGDVAAYAT